MAGVITITNGSAAPDADLPATNTIDSIGLDRMGQVNLQSTSTTRPKTHRSNIVLLLLHSGSFQLLERDYS